MNKLFLFIVAVIALSGCSTNNLYTVTLNAIPAGASIYCDGNLVGNSSTNINYEIPKEERKGNLTIPECHAVWNSGHSQPFMTSVPLADFPEGVTVNTKRRPTGDYQSDYAYGLEVQKLWAMQAQTRAQEQANRDEGWKSIQEGLNSFPKMQTCTNYGNVTQCF